MTSKLLSLEKHSFPFDLRLARYPFSVDMKDALHLAARHAFGIGSSCASLHLLGLPDEHGSCKEHVLHTVGQHLALLRMDDGEMKVRFFTFAKL